MSKNNVRIAIRDSTDSHNVAFFDNKAGIKYKSANLQRFLAGSASILTLKYSSKDIDSIRSGCKLAFRYKNRDYWLNVMSFEKKGFEVELTAYSLGLELNNETRGEHKPANAMSIAEYVAYYDPEHALTIGVNEVSDKRIKLEWTGTDTILARLFSVANSFGAELDFNVELNDDYSLKRQVLNIYKKGNLGTNKVSQPVRVGKELKVINYSDNIKELRTAVRATGKDGLTIDGLNKKIYDSNKQLLYYSSGMTVYAPQSRDRFPSVGKGSNDNWIVEDLGETQYETKEALWGYMYGEIQKKSVPEITYEVEGAIEAGIGDTQTLIDDIHFEPALYVQARVSELEDDILTGKVTKSTFINFERKYSQIADVLLKQVEALAEDAAPYIVRLSTDNGYIFKNGEGSSTITARLEKYSKDIAATWKWVVDNKVVGTGDKLTVKAEQVTNTMAVTVIAYVNGNEVVRDYMTFSNSDDGVGVESIDRYFTSSNQSDGVTIEGAAWSDKPPAPTENGKYLWAYDKITYTDGTVTTTKPAAVGANFDVDAFRAEIAEDLKDVPNREEFENKIAEELATSKAEITTQIETAKTQAETNAKEYADTINQETAKVAELANAAADEIKADLVNVKNNLTSTSLVANNAQAAADAAKRDLANVTSELNTAKQDLADSVAAVNTKVDNAKEELTQAKQELTNVANDLSQAKTDLQNAVSAVDTKATNLKSDLAQAKQDLTNQAQQLQAQANAQSELTNRVSSVEKTANGTKTTVGELSKTVAQNGKDITSVTARTKVVEDDLAGTKTTLSQVQTTANSASQKTATLETGLDGLTAKFNSLSVGGVNLFKGSRDFSGTNWVSDGGVYAEDYRGVKIFKKQSMWNGRSQYFEVKTGEEYVFSAYVKSSAKTDGVNFYLVHESKQPMATGRVEFGSDNRENNVNIGLTDEYQRIAIKIKITSAGWIMPRIERYNTDAYLFFGGYKLERGNVATDYNPNDADLEQKVAEYKQNADQNYASLQTTVQNLDGTVQHNKTVAEQTAQGFKTRIESLETYKDGESERANAYFESAKTETAKQLTAERTAIAKDYVAKSTYTSDVTGIRNDLTATTTTANTTKTNLANYQASNDKVVASLKSSLQTTDGNVSNLQTKVEAVPGQITSAVSAVEGKIPTSVGGRNLLVKTNQGKTNWSWRISSGGTTAEDYNVDGVKAVKLTRTSGASFTWHYIQYDGLIRNLIEPNTKYTLSFDVKPSVGVTFTATLMREDYGAPLTNSATMNKALANQWTEVSCVLTSKATLPNDLSQVVYLDGMPTANGNWLIIKNIKLEKGVVSSDWSPAPDDYDDALTQVKSEIKQTADGMTLLATKTELNTAKTELQSGINTATNKANAAQSAANSNAQTISTHTTQISALNTGLSAKVSQSDFNTLSGRVTTAENNITAKANELSSKITSVEGKIPTSAGGRNLALGTSGDWNSGWTSFNGQNNQLSIIYRIYNRGFKIGDKVNVRLVLKYSDIVAADGQTAIISSQSEGNVTHFGPGRLNMGQDVYLSPNGDEVVLSGTTTITENHLKNEYWIWRLRVDYVASGKIQWKEAKAEVGDLPTPWSPAPEDTAEQISNLSSQIKQTADGITLLATKTELNTAKNELQSGITAATNKASNAQSTANSNAQTISTHTTQISALNTGLQAKVSQTDFNTLSGRVTTAENNITAKANELTSKITSVEGKIPTSVGSVNLFKGSRDFSGSWITNRGVYAEDYQGVKIFKTQAMWNGRSQYFEVKAGEEYVFSAYVKSSSESDSVTFFLSHEQKQPQAQGIVTFNSSNANNSIGVTFTNEYKRIAIKIKITKGGWMAPRIERTNEDAYLFFGGYKLERGNVSTDWTPAPEDTVNQISSLSSQIQQTADGMTLLATKTELSTAKNELQSGINTATNKANAAQSAANNNAQTISTHTTQISALNTGLQAKVSQSEFNTLSGRVTSAENNIIAKANELSSKITSVEGKIPTSVGGRNLIIQSQIQNGYIDANGNLATATSQFTTGFIDGTNNKQFTITAPKFAAGNLEWLRLAKYDANKNFLGRDLISYTKDTKTVKTITLTNDVSYFKVSFDGVYKEPFKVERGNLPTDWSPAPEDYDSKLATAQSEIKQTTDAIKASVSSVQTAASNAQSTANTAVSKADAAQAGVNTLDSTTVKSSSLTINADGIVMKAGKSTTDVANAIGSYFSVNQNAINLFSDKINVKGSMIVNGAITSDKIASKSINTAHLNGKIMTADVIATNAITADAIKAGAVTTDKMSANSINGDRIAAGTLDAAKIKAGSITASQIASGTITSNQIKAGGISSANIAAGAITGDKIAAGAIDANKIAANAITANMIRGGQLNSTNGATVFDLNAGTLTFNNNYGYIQRVASDKIFEITTWLHSADASSPEYLNSAFKIRKSDNSRQAGAKFTLNNTIENKPTAAAIINADSLILSDSQNRTVLSIFSKGHFGNINMQGWGDIPVAQLYNCGLAVKDIGIGGHSKSLLNIVEELCKKANIPWV